MKGQFIPTFLFFFLLISVLQAQNSDPHLKFLLQADQVVSNINSFNKSFREFKLLPDSVRITNSFNDTDVLFSTNYHLFYEEGLIKKVEYLIETGNPDWDTWYRIYFRFDDQNRRISAVEYSVHDGFVEIPSRNLNYSYANGIQVKMQISEDNKIMNGDSVNITYDDGKIDYYQRLIYNVDKKKWEGYREYFDITYDGNKITSFSHNETELANNKLEKFRYENIEDVRTFRTYPFESANSFYNYDTLQFLKNIFSPFQGSEHYPNLRGGYDFYKYDDNTSAYILKEKKVLVDNGIQPKVNEYDLLIPDHVIKVNTFTFNQDNKLDEITIENMNSTIDTRKYEYNSLGRLSKVTYTFDGVVLLIENRIYDLDNDDNLVSYKFQNKSFHSEFSEEIIYLFYYDTELKIKSHEVDKMILYPNPSSDLIYFDVASVIISASIINANGQIMSVKPGDGNLNISHLSPGSYILKLVTKSGVNIARFIKV